MKIKLEVEIDTELEKDQALLMELIKILEEYKNANCE